MYLHCWCVGSICIFSDIILNITANIWMLGCWSLKGHYASPLIWFDLTYWKIIIYNNSQMNISVEMRGQKAKLLQEYSQENEWIYNKYILEYTNTILILHGHIKANIQMNCFSNSWYTSSIYKDVISVIGFSLNICFS